MKIYQFSYWGYFAMDLPLVYSLNSFFYPLAGIYVFFISIRRQWQTKICLKVPIQKSCFSCMRCWLASKRSSSSGSNSISRSKDSSNYSSSSSSNSSSWMTANCEPQKVKKIPSISLVPFCCCSSGGPGLLGVSQWRSGSEGKHCSVEVSMHEWFIVMKQQEPAKSRGSKK